MKNLLLVSLVYACVLSISAPALAGNNPQAKAAIHVRAHNAKAGCNVGTIASCEDISTTYPSESVDVFPVFFNLNEYQELEYGIISTSNTL